MRIAVDAMGGDRAPGEIVRGAIDAALDLPSISKIFLVGQSDAIKKEMDGYQRSSGKVEILHASEVVDMDESPAKAVRKKKDSSIGRAIDLVKHGEADAVVSAGNTGAVVVASTLKLRTLEGVARPSIAVVMPTSGRPFILIDAGANIDSSAMLLMQSAIMGSVYSSVVMKRDNPVVGLLSIGGEDIKGNEITKEAFRILDQSSLNFRGNVEGHDLFKGETDVVVCDGFVGNIVLKTIESTAHAVGYWMKEEFRKNPVRLLGTGLLSGAIKAMKTKMDPEMYGGALLLGVQGVCIITHGASSARAIFHAVRVASDLIGHRLNDIIVEKIKKMDVNI